jgi:signal recognition particle receptor subunit beta
MKPHVIQTIAPQDQRRQNIVKIGEILIVGSSQINTAAFMKLICTDTVIADEDIIFGQISVNHDLSLFLYGISTKNQIGDFHWHMISRKVLGAILLFNWGDQVSLTDTKKRIDYFTSEYNFPIVIAAQSDGYSKKISTTLSHDAISLASKAKFVFYDKSDLISVKNILTTLINIIINLQP